MDVDSVGSAPTTEFTHMKRAELQRLCKQYNLKASGKNVEMVERLRQYADSGNIVSSSPVPPAAFAIPQPAAPSPSANVFTFGTPGPSPGVTSFTPQTSHSFSFTFLDQSNAPSQIPQPSPSQIPQPSFSPALSFREQSRIPVPSPRSFTFNGHAQPESSTTPSMDILVAPESPVRSTTQIPDPTFNAAINNLNDSLVSMSVDDPNARPDDQQSQLRPPEDDMTARIMAELEARAKADAPALKAAGMIGASMTGSGGNANDDPQGKGKFDAVHQKQFRRMQSISEHFAAKRTSTPNLKEKAAIGDKRKTKEETTSSQPAKRMKLDERATTKPQPPVPVIKARVTPKVRTGAGRFVGQVLDVIVDKLIENTGKRSTTGSTSTATSRTPLSYRRPGTTARTPATKPASTVGSRTTTTDIRPRAPSTSTPSTTSGVFTFGSAKTHTQTTGQDFHGVTKKPVFDLKESLKKPMSWIPHKGPLRDTRTPAAGSR
ncbi:hypothetical protein HDV00_000083 [Rhizophlyctis rosea]|nr:hypothetical protein HDV00_000083 [Rhizophlyctis rosea]